LPPEVQSEVIRREREVQTALQQSSQARQFTDKLQQTIAPYQQLIALEGGDPMKSFQDYLKTASTLRMGTQVEKANAVAQAIKTFGIDVASLDQALVAIMGGQPLPAQPQQAQQPLHDPRLDQLLAQLQQREEAQQQGMQNELAQEIAEFAGRPEYEFFEDLREDMSVLLSTAAQRGRTLNLAQAYAHAAQLNPEIKKVLDQRAAAQKVKTDTPFIAAKRAAASSVRGIAPNQTGPANGQTASIRDAIEAALSSGNA
jgi:hypothetical protein